MPAKPLPLAELRRDYEALKATGGNQVAAARLRGLNADTFKTRVRNMRQRGFDLDACRPPKPSEFPHRAILSIYDGCVIVGSDAHYWPGQRTTAHRAFLRLCEELRPQAVILNGDVLDGARISRHAPIGWEKRPTLIEELEACKERLHEIERAAGDARRIWTLGNHDARFETRLATVAPEYAKVHGVHLKDHFPAWEAVWSVWINDDAVVKHRFKSGIHAPWNNTMWAGRTMVTGHLHSQKVYPLSDYNGTRWGVDTGCIADPYDEQFRDYTEDAPVNWRSGFAVLTWWKGRLLTPELVRVIEEGLIEFRGGVIAV
jgi:hypothetical protein